MNVCLSLPAVTQKQSVSRLLNFTQNVNMILFSHLPMKSVQFSLSKNVKSPTQMFSHHDAYQPFNYPHDRFEQPSCANIRGL